MTLYTLNRTPGKEQCFGSWVGLDGNELCKTIELPWRDNHPRLSCIPAATYSFDRYESPRHGHVWMAQNVPERSQIEVHNANFAAQLLGCIGVGDSIGQILGVPAVLNSMGTLAKLRTLLPDTFQLTINNL